MFAFTKEPHSSSFCCSFCSETSIRFASSNLFSSSSARNFFASNLSLICFFWELSELPADAGRFFRSIRVDTPAFLGRDGGHCSKLLLLGSKETLQIIRIFMGPCPFLSLEHWYRADNSDRMRLPLSLKCAVCILFLHLSQASHENSGGNAGKSEHSLKIWLESLFIGLVDVMEAN
jgi:hypothetical protein